MKPKRDWTTYAAALVALVIVTLITTAGLGMPTWLGLIIGTAAAYLAFRVVRTGTGGVSPPGSPGRERRPRR